ncbi:MAG: hypothetical protein WB760_22900 [Xanthobacteraceae bacterium]
MADIGVVYLYRFAEGELPARAFLDSYRVHPAGLDHELHVIFKGFPDARALGFARTIFAGLPINPIELDDSGHDVGSYFAAAKRVSNRRLIFFNTFSELLADDWLKKFDDALSLPEVGLVGATGSWQSLNSYYEAVIRLGWQEIKHKLGSPTRLAPSPPPAKENQDMKGNNGDTQRIPASKKRPFIVQIGRGLYRLVRLDRYFLYLYQYGRFPNPHIRTNAFMIERNRFLSLHAPPFDKKGDLYKFESGRRSMTKQILSQGLKPLVVDRTGKVYNASEWKSSSTFWINRQRNLIAADNRTRDYAQGDEALRTWLEDNAWAYPSSWTTRGRRFWASE